ncbi:MAG: hypothetical protein RSE91_04045, partial [Bacilli bacterium]
MNLTIQDNYQKIIPYKGKYYKIIPLIKKTITIIILCTLVIILLNKKINYFYLISLLPFIFILSYLLLKTKNKKEPSLRLLTISLKENELILEYPKTLVYDKQYNEVWQKEQYKCYYKDIKTINYSIEDKRIEIYGKFHI